MSNIANIEETAIDVYAAIAQLRAELEIEPMPEMREHIRWEISVLESKIPAAV